MVGYEEVKAIVGVFPYLSLVLISLLSEFDVPFNVDGTGARERAM